jgi:hypothetical protein
MGCHNNALSDLKTFQWSCDVIVAAQPFDTSLADLAGLAAVSGIDVGKSPYLFLTKMTVSRPGWACDTE